MLTAILINEATLRVKRNSIICYFYFYPCVLLSFLKFSEFFSHFAKFLNINKIEHWKIIKNGILDIIINNYWKRLPTSEFYCTQRTARNHRTSQ